MARTATAVQSPRDTVPASVWLSVGDPIDLEKGQLVVRLTLELTPEELDFLRRFASYRNTLARMNKQKLKQAWSRKSLAEHLLRIQIDGLKSQMAAMFEALGPLPDAKDREAMAKYVASVLAWNKRAQKKQSSSDK